MRPVKARSSATASLQDGVEAPARRDLAGKHGPADPPGGGDDVRLHRVALDAVETRWLVHFVEEASRDQEQAGAGAQALVEVHFQIALLEIDTAVEVGIDGRMFVFDLGEETDPIGELVTEEQNGAVEIDLVLVRGAAVPIEVVVVQLAVAADDGAPGLAVFERAVRCPERGFPLLARCGGACGEFVEHLARGLDLLLRGLELALELLDLLLLLLDDAPHILGAREGGGLARARGGGDQCAQQSSFHRVFLLVAFECIALKSRCRRLPPDHHYREL